MPGATRAVPVIVAGVDCSDRSVPVLEWAARQARAVGGHVRVVTAWHFPDVLGHRPVRVEADLSTHLEDIVSRLVARTLSGVPCDTVIREDSPQRLLLREAAEADLLVLGNRGHDHEYRPGLGSVTFACLDAAPCAVVVVPVTQPRSDPSS
jgi:nucleotide-binding universal stress UspA family protein